MHPYYPDFNEYLDQEDKENSVKWVLSRIQDNSVDIVSLYNEILTPALIVEFCKADQKEVCIWKEHIRTSIVRTIIECCYPHVIRERNQKYHSVYKGKTFVLCPPGELHEIGARMIADFFVLCGFNVVFAGANTPQGDIMNAIEYEKPAFVAISVTNYFNLVEARNLIQNILVLRNSLNFRIILGGQACQSNPAACLQFDPDLILHSFEEIKRLSEGGNSAAV